MTPTRHHPTVAPGVLGLALLVGSLAMPAWASDADPTAQARATYAEVNQNTHLMAAHRFRARVPGAAYTSTVVAWLEKGQVRKLAVTDPDDSGNVLTDLYFSADGALVFALRTIQGFKPNGAVETRNEHRLYFQQGGLARMLAGLSKTVLPASDPLAQAESATTLAMAQALRTAALAPPSPTVAVGTQRKLAQGGLVGLERGDVACHIELTDDVGRVHREMADFVLCDNADRLSGQHVALAYTPTRVMAAACQGDTACTRHEVVALVTRATPAPTSSTASASWCRPGETNLFTCHTAQKRVSVCVSPGASAQQGQLLYRFGLVTGGAPELELPTKPSTPARAATGEATGFAGGGGVWLRFAHGHHAYVVYSGVGRWGRGGATEARQGVQVERNGKTLATLACGAPQVDELGPDWLQRLGVAADAQGFVFPNTGP